MQRIGAWRIQGGRPERLQFKEQVALEEHLEGWIAEDPKLLSSTVQVLGRQVRVDAGLIDLLALDHQGRFVIIEVKKGQLRREAVAQALDYAASIAELDGDSLVALVDRSLSNLGTAHAADGLRSLLEELDALEALDPESRRLALIVCGVGVAPGLERMIDFLSDHADLEMSLVSFQALEVAEGSTVLIRELTEPDVPKDTNREEKIQDVVGLSRQYGMDASFQLLHKAAEDVGLYARPWKTSVMYAPPANRTRCLFTTWARPSRGKLRIYLASEGFSEFYSISPAQVAEVLGPEGWRYLDTSEAEHFAAGIRRLFAEQTDGM